MVKSNRVPKMFMNVRGINDLWVLTSVRLFFWHDHNYKIHKSFVHSLSAVSSLKPHDLLTKLRSNSSLALRQQIIKRKKNKKQIIEGVEVDQLARSMWKDISRSNTLLILLSSLVLFRWNDCSALRTILNESKIVKYISWRLVKRKTTFFAHNF